MNEIFSSQSESEEGRENNKIIHNIQMVQNEPFKKWLNYSNVLSRVVEEANLEDVKSLNMN